MTTQQVLDRIHIEIHAIRLIPDYKPSKFEQNLNKIISEEYSKECKECKERVDRPKEPKEKKGMFGQIGDIIKGGVE